MRIICLDQAHAPDVGHPTYVEDRPDLRDQPVWAVADVEEADEDWDFDYLAEGLTVEQAESY